MSARPAVRAIVVLGYGCHLTPAVRRFLDAASRDISELCQSPKEGERPLLITSGGFTNPRSAPGVSEAARFADYLRQSRGVGLEVALDEEALTTLHNIRGVHRILRERQIAAEQVVICCDEARQEKISYAARRILGAAPALWLYDLGRTRWQREVQRVFGLVFDALCLASPTLEALSLRYIEVRNSQR